MRFLLGLFTGFCSKFFKKMDKTAKAEVVVDEPKAMRRAFVKTERRGEGEKMVLYTGHWHGISLKAGYMVSEEDTD